MVYKNILKKIRFKIYFITIFMILIHIQSVVTSSEIMDISDNKGDWHIWRWYEFINITREETIEGWIVIYFQFLNKITDQDYKVYFDIPAYNESVEYYIPYESSVSIKRWETETGVDIEMTFNKSISNTLKSIDIAVHYTGDKDKILSHKNEWFESIIKYKFEMTYSIWGDILPAFGEEDSTFVNVYISLPDESSVATPEGFSLISDSMFKELSTVTAVNWQNETLGNKILPKIKPSQNDYKTIRYRGRTSPRDIVFEYSYTNTNIIFITFLAAILGAIGTCGTILGRYIKNKFIQSKSNKRLPPDGELKTGPSYKSPISYIGIGLILVGPVVSILFQRIELLTFFIPFGLAVFSLGVTFSSSKLAKISDEKMKAVALSNFINIDFRLEHMLRKIRTGKNKFDVNARRGYVWDFERSIEQARVLLEWIDDPRKHENISTRLKSLMEELPWDNSQYGVINEEVNNLVKTYMHIWRFNLTNERRNELIALFEMYISERKDNEKDDGTFIENVFKDVTSLKLNHDKYSQKQFNKLLLDIRSSVK